MQKYMKRLWSVLVPFCCCLVAACTSYESEDIYRVRIFDIVGDVSGITAVGANFGFNMSVTTALTGSGASIKLPKRILANELFDISSFFGEFSDAPDAKWSEVFFHGYKDGNPVGSLSEAASATQEKTIIQYIYVDRNVRIMGDVLDHGFGYDVDLDLRKGWNRISVRTVFYEGAPRLDIYRNEVPASVEWRFERYEVH